VSETKETASPRSLWIGLNGTVFLAAACIMTVEILSTRLVARYLGSSLYTWTTAIGVVLAGISLGNYWGGRLADRYDPRRTLSLLFIASSVGCITIPFVNGLLGQWSFLEDFSWPVRILIHFGLTFLLPATLMGTMSPVVAKMALTMSVVGPGRTVGTIYAWGSIGSIFGTFAAGFWLVSRIGTEGSIFVVSGVLALAGLWYGRGSFLPLLWGGGYGAVLFCVLGPWSWNQAVAAGLGLEDPNADRLLFDEDSHYQKVMVVDLGNNRRQMLLDSLTHSKVDLGDPLELEYEYEAIYAEVLHAVEPGTGPLNALFVGGGGCVFPRYLEIVRPGSHIEVAEIDPVVTRAAFEAFGIPRETGIEFYDLDARNHITDLVRRRREGEDIPDFDVIFGDAYNDFTVPFHLVTLEYAELLADLLGEEGVYMLNLIEILDQPRLMGPVITTLRQVFPNVHLFGAYARSNDRNTFVIVASKRALDLSEVRNRVLSQHGIRTLPLGLEHVDRVQDRGGRLVMTDDYAPVENLLTHVIRGKTDRVGSMLSSFAHELERLLEEGREDEALVICRRALEIDPEMPQVHQWTGTVLARLLRFDEALVEFRTEFEKHRTPDSLVSAAKTLSLMGDRFGAVETLLEAVVLHPRDADAHMLLVELFLAEGRKPEAEIQLRRLIEARPGNIRGRLALGNLLHERGASEEAVRYYEDALLLDPDYPGLVQDHGLALLHAGRPQEAIPRFQRALSRDEENAVLHNQLGRALGMASRSEEAVASFRRAVELEPDEASYRANLGLALAESGEEAEAVEQYRTCLRLDAGNLPVANALAFLLATAEDRRLRSAEEALQRAEELLVLVGPENPDALFTLACAQREAGQGPASRESALRALAQARRFQMSELAERIAQSFELD